MSARRRWATSKNGQVEADCSAPAAGRWSAWSSRAASHVVHPHAGVSRHPGQPQHTEHGHGQGCEGREGCVRMHGTGGRFASGLCWAAWPRCPGPGPRARRAVLTLAAAASGWSEVAAGHDVVGCRGGGAGVACWPHCASCLTSSRPAVQRADPVCFTGSDKKRPSAHQQALNTIKIRTFQ